VRRLVVVAALLVSGCGPEDADVGVCEAFVRRDGAAGYERLGFVRDDSAPMTLAAFRKAAGLPEATDEVSRLSATRLELAAKRGQLQLRRLALQYRLSSGEPQTAVCAFRLVDGELPEAEELARAGDTSLADGRATLARVRGKPEGARPKYDCCL